MTATRHSRLLQFTGLLLSALVWLANNGNPPTGKTGAPFDGTCGDATCHTGNNPGGYDGDLIISGIPGTIVPNTVYPLTLTMNVTAGSPTKGGFQLVVVDGNNVNAGDLSIANAQTGTEFFATREYIEHRLGNTFAGGTASWDFNWKSPISSVNGNTLKFYFIGNFTNGNGQPTGDFPKAFLETHAFNGPPPVTAVITNSTNVLCFGGNTGSATVEAGDGTPPYTYMWNNGQTTATATNLFANTYTVTVTGAGGSGTASASVTITQPPVLNISAAPSGVLTCAQTSVTATATVSGGTPSYNVAWSNGQSGTSATFSSPGTYSVTATDANGCTKGTSVTITQNISAPTDTTNVSGMLTCATDSVQIFMNTNIQNATFLWTGPNGFMSTQKKDTIAVPGQYIGVVTNPANGCKTRDTIVVEQNIDPPGATAMASGAITCVNDTVQLTGGPSGANTYVWTGPNNYTSTQQNPTVDTAGMYTLVVTADTTGCTSSATVMVEQNTTPPVATIAAPDNLDCNNATVQLNATGSSQGPNFSYLWTTTNGVIVSGETTLAPVVSAAGTYKLLVTNANNGCTSTASTSVSQSPPVLATITSSTNVTCNGAANGAASAVGSGGNGTFTYLWSNGATTASITGLSAGTYNVTVKDGENCTATAMVSITQPSPLLANATATGETSLGANDGTATSAPTGGTPGYSFSWSNGGATATITDLAPGSYTVSVTDANNCTAVQTVNVAAFNCAIAASVSGADASCFGKNDGQATAVLSGGQLPYSYLWSNGATTATANNLLAGTYTVTGTDAAGCSTTESITISEPTALTAIATNIQNVVCPSGNTGSASIVASGGTAPYMINGTLSNLGVGTHTATVVDTNGCSTMVSFTIVATDSQAPVVSCPANIYICGANIVSWPGGVTVTDNCGSLPGQPVLISGQPSGSAFNDGTTVQVFRATDASGNSATCSFAVVVYPVADILFDGSADDQNGQGIGSISVTPVGGGGNFFFIWNKNGQFFSNDEDLSGLMAGSYTLTLTDGNGCTSALSPVVINNTVGTFDLGKTGSIRLSPNPTAAAFQLEIIGFEVVAASILDIRGRVVYQMQPLEWRGEVSVNQLSTGIYFLRLATDSGKLLTLKFVKTE